MSRVTYAALTRSGEWGRVSFELTGPALFASRTDIPALLRRELDKLTARTAVRGKRALRDAVPFAPARDAWSAVTAAAPTVTVGWLNPDPILAVWQSGTGPAVGRPAYWPPAADGSRLAAWAARHNVNQWAARRAVHRKGTIPHGELIAVFQREAARFRTDLESTLLRVLSE